MKEEDIDKIFQNAFAEGDNQPISESDWNQFEGLIPAKKKGWGSSAWLLLLLLPCAAIAYLYFGEETPLYQQRTAAMTTTVSSVIERSRDVANPTKEQRTLGNSLEEENQANFSQREVDHTREDQSAPRPAETDTDPLANHPEKNTVLSTEVNTPTGRADEKENAQLNLPDGEGYEPSRAIADTGGPPSSDPNAEIPAPVFTEVNPASNTTDTKAPASADIRAAKEATNQAAADVENTTTAAGRNLPESTNHLEGMRFPLSGNGNAEMNFNPRYMNPSGLQPIMENVMPALADDQREINQPSVRGWTPFVYLKAGTHSVLRTSAGVGLGGVKPLGSNGFAIRATVGYLRSGELTSTQRSSSTNYGFDRYVEAVELKTKTLHLLQVPVHLQWSPNGIHRLYAGMESSFVINAAQELRAGEGSTSAVSPKEGYLFQAPVPEWMYAFQAGYAYRLNEKFDLEVGASFSPQEWGQNTSENSGIFLKLNYLFK